ESEVANPLNTGSLRPPRFFCPHAIRNAYADPARWSMIPKSGNRFSGEIVLQKKVCRNSQVLAATVDANFDIEREPSGRDLRRGYLRVYSKLGLERGASTRLFRGVAAGEQVDQRALDRGLPRRRGDRGAEQVGDVEHVARSLAEC